MRAPERESEEGELARATRAQLRDRTWLGLGLGLGLG